MLPYYLGRLSPYSKYLNNAIVTVNILKISLLEVPLEYLGAYPLRGQIFVLWQGGVDFLVIETIEY